MEDFTIYNLTIPLYNLLLVSINILLIVKKLCKNGHLIQNLTSYLKYYSVQSHCNYQPNN